MNKRLLLLFVSTVGLANPAFALGGLTKATVAVAAINVWFYGFLGVACVGFIIYHVCMAMAEKESWNDVLMAVVKVTAAGGSVALAAWAWSLFGLL